MTTIVKPMLAKDPKYNDEGQPIVPFPCVVQPKLDGIRCFIVDGVARSRTFKPIPNAEIQAALGRSEFNGLDGEIIVGDATAEGCMQATTSFVMAPNKTGEDWTFHVFDKWNHPGDTIARLDALSTHARDARWFHNMEGRIAWVESKIVKDIGALQEFEEFMLLDGHEGIIVRDPSAPYKHGRSGTKGPLLKVKRFIDFEAEVIGVYEEQHNANEAKKDAFGRTERSTMKAGKVGKDRLGGLMLQAINGPAAGVRFRCGTGFNAEQRERLWAAWSSPDDSGLRLGDVVKIKSFPIGVKDKPRFPVFLGFRDMEVDG